MRLKRCFSIAMLIVGTVIGAGFASGAEIVSFFGAAANPLNAVVCAALTFGGCVLFLILGSRFKPKDIGELNALSAGKLHVLPDGFLLLNALIVTAGMIAAFDSLGRSIFGFGGLGMIFGVLAALTVMRGIGGLIKLNSFVLPGVIVTLIVVCTMSIDAASFNFALSDIRPVSSVVYVSMNMILAAGTLTCVRDLTGREVIASSAVAAAVIGVLMAGIMLALSSSRFDSALPTLDMAIKIGKAAMWLTVISMSVSIFTTLLSAVNCLTDYAHGILGSRALAAFCVLAVGMLLSVLGFERVVGALYPVIGVLGVAYVIMNIVFLIRSRPRSSAEKKSLPLSGKA